MQKLSDEISYHAVTDLWYAVKSKSQDGKSLTVEPISKEKLKSFTADLDADSRIWATSEPKTDASHLRIGEKVLFQLRSDGKKSAFSELMTESGFKTARQRQQDRHLSRLKELGLPGVINDVNLATREVLLTLNRSANHLALRLHQHESVSLKRNSENAQPTKTLLLSVKPDGERLKVRLTADGTQLARFSIADEVSLIVASNLTDRRQWLPDYVKNGSLDEQTSYLLAWLYCPCEISGLNCGGQIFGVHACTHECRMPQQLHQEVVDFFKEGLSPEEIVDRLQKRHGNMLLSHLL